tara:strand:- start:202184 stop:204106 length:1923 start_codon:yes stop_codon:yes gene_type:complete
MSVHAAQRLSAFWPWAALAVVLLVTAWIYGPGTAGPLMLDDRSSLGDLSGLSETPQQALDAVLGDTSGFLGRPVSMASFVAEKLWFGDAVAISKQVNVGLHLFTGCLVVWLLWSLLDAARFPAAPGLAVLAGAAWLLAPLQVSTVLYTVQRMAMLAAFFSLACLISYLYWRKALVRGERGVIPFILTLFFFALAVFSKENALVLLPLLLLLEMLCLRYVGPRGQRIVWLQRLSQLGVLIVAATVGWLLVAGLDWLEGRFVRREFTLYERLYTQARVLWDYLGQLLWPDVSRMGVYHDDLVVSSGLGDPVTTLYALLAWLAVLFLCAGLCWLKTGRYLVFGIAFFLAAHITESSVWPLELYFEHRNYLPAVGIFLLLAVALGSLIRRFPETRMPLFAWAGIAVLMLAMQTSSQVQIWSSKPLLHLNNVTAHPHSFRANTAMAGHLALLGELDAALAYSARAHASSRLSAAMNDERAGDWVIRDVALSCMANAPLPSGRLQSLGEQRPGRPLAIVNNVQILVELQQSGRCPQFNWVALADRLEALYLLPVNPATASTNMYSVLAALENALARYDRAYAYTTRLLAQSPDNIRGQFMHLHFATALGKRDEANALRRALLALQAQGELTVEEQANLALYPDQSG